MQPQTTIRAGVYSRVSTFLQRSKGYGLAVQDDDVDAHIDRCRYEVAGRWDDDESGADWDLPGLNDMLDAARAGAFSVLVVPEPDRFARNATKAFVLQEELRRMGVRVEYARFPLEDSLEGDPLKGQLTLFAAYERGKIAIRTAGGRRAKAKRGLVVGAGAPPYGYVYTEDAGGRVNGLEPDPETAPVFQRIVRELVSRSLADVCVGLNADGVPTPRTVHAGRLRHPMSEDERATRSGRPRKAAPPSGSWAPTTLRYLLTNPVYTGTYAYRRQDAERRPRDVSEWLTVPVTPLVTPEDLAAVRAALDHRRPVRASQLSEDPYTLRGLLRCVSCGGTLACWPINGHRYYACLRSQPRRARLTGAPVCDMPAARADRLETLAWEAVTETLLDGDGFRAAVAARLRASRDVNARHRARLATIDREVEALRARLVKLTIQAADADDEGARALEGAIAQTKAEIAGHTRERAALAAQPQPGLSEEAARALVEYAATLSPEIAAEATREERRTVYTQLRLVGTVRVAQPGEPGERLGRLRREYVITWDALIALKRANSERNRSKNGLRYLIPQYGIQSDARAGLAVSYPGSESGVGCREP